MFFYRTTAQTTVHGIGDELGVASTDLWLPLAACVPAKGTTTVPYSIKDNTPVALLDKSNNTLLFNRLKITEMLQITSHSNGRNLSIVPAEVPSGFAVYMRWSFAGSKQVAADTIVLYRSIASVDAALEGSCFLKRRASRAQQAATPSTSAVDDKMDQRSVDASTIANTLMSAHDARAKVRRSNTDFDERLRSALSTAENKELLSRVDMVFRKTVEKLRRHGGEAPLHFVVAKEAREVFAAGVRWSRPDSRLLHRVFRPDGGADSSVFKDATRQLLFLFVDQVLYSSTLRSLSETATVLDDSRCARIATQLLSYAKRGFRIVFIDHFPQLHHGTAYTLETTVRPLVDFYTKYCAPQGLSVSVILSTVSNISATQHRETFASFAPPQTGLYYYFVSQLNASFEADPKLSTFVNPFLSGADFRAVTRNEFCQNIAFKTISVDAFLEGP